MCVQVYMHDSECVNLTLVLMSSSIAIQKRHFRIAECKPMKPPSAWLARLSAETATTVPCSVTVPDLPLTLNSAPYQGITYMYIMKY